MRWVHLWVVLLFVWLGTSHSLTPVWEALGHGTRVGAPLALGLSVLLLWPFYRDRVATSFWRFSAWLGAGILFAIAVNLLFL